MDPATFFSSQTGILVMVVGVVGAAIVAVLGISTGKKEFMVILDRIRPSTDQAGGQSSIYLARTKQGKRDAEKQIILPDKTKMTIPEEEMKLADTLTINKKFSLKAGTYRLLGKEAGNLVMFAASFADTSHLMLDNKTTTKVNNRSSLVRLAAGAGGILAENMLYIVLALMAGVSVGWILYPNFNHPPPVFEYCTRLGNGSLIPRGCPG